MTTTHNHDFSNEKKRTSSLHHGRNETKTTKKMNYDNDDD